MSRSTQKKHSETSSTNVADGFLELGIKVTLLISLFPISLLFLVAFYGFEGAASIVKNLLASVLRSIFSLVFIILGIYMLLVVAGFSLQAIRGT